MLLCQKRIDDEMTATLMHLDNTRVRERESEWLSEKENCFGAVFLPDFQLIGSKSRNIPVLCINLIEIVVYTHIEREYAPVYAVTWTR